MVYIYHIIPSVFALSGNLCNWLPSSILTSKEDAVVESLCNSVDVRLLRKQLHLVFFT